MGQLPAVLAVDGGNSKADLALLADDGTAIVAIRRPGFSHQTVGPAEAASRLAAAGAELRALADLPAGSPIARMGSFCLAGADLPSDDRLLAGMLDEVALTERWSLHNDVFAVLRAGTEGVGVAVVCGAGMNCVGVAADGRFVRYPALGELSGDLAAGGRWLGARGLAMAIRAEDGRGAPSSLARLVPEHFGLQHPLEVTEAVYDGSIGDARVLELAPGVLGAAADGDEVAARLVGEVADEIVTTVRATMHRLDLLDARVPVVLGGGLFRATRRLLQRLVADQLADVAPNAEVRVLQHHPVVGAALLGFDDLGTSEAVSDTVHETLDAAISVDRQTPDADPDGAG